MTDSRRKFLLKSVSATSAAWLAANWPTEVAAAEKAQAMGAFTFFSRAQAGDVDAIASQIYPTTDTPGAREAQVVYFIDLALVTFAQDKQDIYAKGLADLPSHTGGKAFSSLPSDQQVAVLTEIETTPFFKTVREHTIMGMFAAPKHGGNFDKVGWQEIGFDDSLNFRAPFGAYDQA